MIKNPISRFNKLRVRERKTYEEQVLKNYLKISNTTKTIISKSKKNYNGKYKNYNILFLFVLYI